MRGCLGKKQYAGIAAAYVPKAGKSAGKFLRKIRISDKNQEF